MTVTVLGPRDIKEDARERLLENITLGCRGISSMTVSYTGGPGANLTLDKKGKSKNTITDNGDGTYTVTPDKDKLGSRTRMYVDGVRNADFLTSRSRAIEAGDTDGDFTMTVLDKILGDISKGEPKRIAKAIKGIDRSLNPKYWIDETHLDCKHGHRVFSEERHAIKELMHLLSSRKNKAGSEALAAALATIETLVEVDRTLATTLILEAEGTPVVSPRDHGKVDRALAQAHEALSKGDADRDDGKWDKAVQHYRTAWEAASKAIEKATGTQCGGGG